MKYEEGLLDYIIENWAEPLKTVSFWVLTILFLTLRDSIYNNTSFKEFVGFDLLNYIAFILVVVFYIFAKKIDSFVLSILKK